MWVESQFVCVAYIDTPLHVVTSLVRATIACNFLEVELLEPPIVWRVIAMHHQTFPDTPTTVITTLRILPQPSQGVRRTSGRGSFTNRGHQPKLNPKGARNKARTGSSSDYSKADFMKTPQGGGYVAGLARAL